MECLGWELKVCPEFTPVPDLFDESVKKDKKNKKKQNGPG